MSDQNKAVVERFIDEVWNAHNLDGIDQCIAEDHVDHDPARAGTPQGRDGMREFVAAYLTAFPDAHVTIDELVAEGDLVTARWHATGTHQGELMGMPATGRSIDITGIGIDRIADGKIAESWQNFDMLGMLRQLGAVPEPAGASA